MQVLQLYSVGPALQPVLEQPSSLWVPWSHEFWSASAYIINRPGMRKVCPWHSHTCQIQAWARFLPSAVQHFSRRADLGQLHSCAACWLRLMLTAVQILELYAPGSLNASAVTTVQMPKDPPCNAEQLVFKHTTSFTCTDLFVYEEVGVSTIHRDETHADLHLDKLVCTSRRCGHTEAQCTEQDSDSSVPAVYALSLGPLS